MAKNKDDYFVEIVEHKEVRRNVLESLKDIVEILQGFEKFKKIRKEKIHKMKDLRGDMKTLNKLIGNLRACLPEVQKDVKARGSRKGSKTASEGYKGIKPQSELEKLETELSVIEDKLKSLE